MSLDEMTKCMYCDAYDYTCPQYYEHYARSGCIWYWTLEHDLDNLAIGYPYSTFPIRAWMEEQTKTKKP